MTRNDMPRMPIGHTNTSKRRTISEASPGLKGNRIRKFHAMDPHFLNFMKTGATPINLSDEPCAETVDAAPFYDSKLLESALRGDQKAGKLLVERLSPLIRRCVRRMNVKRRTHLHEERDFIQEIWARLICDNGRLLKQYDWRRGGRLESYLFVIIQREIGNQLQKERAVKRGLDITDGLEVAGDTPVDNNTPREYAEAREFAAHLNERLQQILPERGMDVWRRAVRDGVDPQAIANALHVSIQVVYNWLYKIRLFCIDFIESDEK